MEPQDNMNMVGQEPKGGSAGPIIGIIVILIIIILGGLYFWNERSENMVTEDESMETINEQNESDDTTSIEADLDATDIDNVDSEINAS